MKKFLVVVLVMSAISCFTSCVQTPTVEESKDSYNFNPGGVFILCEGLWRQDNAVMSYVSPYWSPIADLFASTSTSRLGDTPTDLCRVGDTVFVAVNTTQQISLVNALTGELLASPRITLPQQPYRITAHNGKLYVTNLNDDSITEIDARSLSVGPTVTVGPAPEGIAIANSKIYVGISGLGDLRKDEPGAGTIKVLSARDLSTITTIPALPNVADIVADTTRDLVWASYRHYASMPDSLGGVVLIDARADTIIHHWRLSAPTSLTIDPDKGHAYVLFLEGIQKLELTGTDERYFTHFNGYGSEVWYSIHYDPRSDYVYVGNARNFVTNGEVVRIRRGSIWDRAATGLNPSRMTQ